LINESEHNIILTHVNFYIIAYRFISSSCRTLCNTASHGQPCSISRGVVTNKCYT